MGTKGGVAKIALTHEQRQELAKALSFPLEAIPTDFPVVGLSRTEGARMGIPKEMAGKFLPHTMIIS